MEVKRFKCGICGAEFCSDRSDETLIEEFRKTWGRAPEADEMGRVCDPCNAVAVAAFMSQIPGED